MAGLTKEQITLIIASKGLDTAAELFSLKAQVVKANYEVEKDVKAKAELKRKLAKIEKLAKLLKASDAGLDEYLRESIAG
jgi:hypothetical protein